MNDTAFLFAKDLQSAQVTAVVDWEWNALGHDRWRDDDGNIVKFAYSANGLRGRPVGTKLYLGYGHREHRDYEHVQIMIEMKRLVVARTL